MRALAVLAVAAIASAVSAAEPGGPRRFTLGAEVSAALAAEDKGFFNYTSYSDSEQRLARLSVTAEWRATEQAAVLAEVRDENMHQPRVYALYLRVRPWRERAMDVQAGLIPPVFGAFARRRYGGGNPLVGLPLAYQYLTSLRDDAVPGGPADLVANRGAGWLVRYPFGYGERRPEAGIPLVNALQWDAGAQVRLDAGAWEAAAAVTQGALSSPHVRDDNGGKQLSGRVAWTGITGLVLGASGARGEYLSRDALTDVTPIRRGPYRQQAWGLDAEYSWDRWILRSEAVWSAWESPMIAQPLRALAITGESRCKIVPGLYAAARLDRLGFSRIDGPARPIDWDAAVWRVEAGAGYTPVRHVLAKLVYQHNWRDGGRVREQRFLIGQVLLWF